MFRSIKQRGLDVDVVGINDLTDAKTLAHLLKYDSAHGRFDGDVQVDGSDIIVNGDRIAVTAERNIADLPWSDLDMVIESTGVFTKNAQLTEHLKHA